jgi:hypothetical protein
MVAGDGSLPLRAIREGVGARMLCSLSRLGGGGTTVIADGRCSQGIVARRAPMPRDETWSQGSSLFGLLRGRVGHLCPAEGSELLDLAWWM